MLQTRTRVLDDTLRAKFQSWYPGLFNAHNPDHAEQGLAAWPQGISCFPEICAHSFRGTGITKPPDGILAQAIPRSGPCPRYGLRIALNLLSLLVPG